ncbi:MAG: hypothetical protein HN405_06705 [Planctomycetes bacterium]|jgi:uncharacterized pyridoxamine 5'-phosphate oxidase family protein|nr:hypothetical protein [Planctomycetota bacterium]MBT5100370.1 hypothetical protein [Planctomycetota bacterium]MBT7011549.1 hypothetical protein [Planctomycetota bacterium]
MRLLLILTALLLSMPVALSANLHYGSGFSVAAFAAVSLDKSKVRYGNPASFDAERQDKVGTIRSKEIYRAIPAFQKIEKGNIKKGSAQYTKLMGEATKVYRKALKSVAISGAYVILVEQGGISDYSVTDVTAGVIAIL